MGYFISYTLKLTCDGKKCVESGLPESAEYTEAAKALALTMASLDGWQTQLSHDRALCPACAKEAATP